MRVLTKLTNYWQNNMKNIIFISILLVLSGCKTISEKPVELPTITRVAPQDALIYCEQLRQLDGNSFGDVVKKLGEVTTLYKTCSSKQKQLADYIENK